MSNASDHDRESDGEITGQIRSVSEESKRLSDQVKHQKERVSRKLAALRRRLADRRTEAGRSSR